MRKRFGFPVIVLTLIFSLVPGLCAAQNYRLAVLPRHFPIYMLERFSGLAEAIESETGLRVELDIAASYEDHLHKVQSGVAQLSFQNPLIFLKVSNQVTPVAVARQGKTGTFTRGLIIVRRDSGITDPKALKGKKVAVVSTQSAGGYLSQKEFLKKRGIDAVTDLILHEATDNIEENVILDVFEKRTEAGFISAESLHRMDRAIDPGQIRVLSATDPVPGWIFAAHNRVPAADVKRIQNALFKLGKDAALAGQIGVDGFVAPDPAFLGNLEKIDFW